MKLHSQEWGTGDRVAVLVHGIMSDHRTWRKVGPALAARGYRVIGVDLRGHGASGRGAYDASSFADDLVESVPAGVELALGHSLGGLVLSLAVERLAPARAVYSDPAWALGTTRVDPVAMREFQHADRARIEMLAPRWDAEDIDIELATLRAWDPDTTLVLTGDGAVDRIPERAVTRSLIQLADPSQLVPAELRNGLTARGFEIHTVPGAGHSIHRDDFDGFMASLDGWI